MNPTDLPELSKPKLSRKKTMGKPKFSETNIYGKPQNSKEKTMGKPKLSETNIYGKPQQINDY